MSHRWSIASIQTLALLASAVVAGAWIVTGSAAQAAGFLSNDEPKQQERPSYDAPAARKPVEGDGAAALEAELYNASLAVKEARQNLETAQYNLTRARTRGYPRGTGLLELKEAVKRMETEKEDAERNFLDVFARARTGGVPAGVLSSYYDLEEELSNAY